MPESLRLFVAIELPGEVREALGRLQHELQRRGLEKLRWVRPEGIHLTLKFLGETPAEKVAAIEEALEAPIARTKPFSFSLVWPRSAHGPSQTRVLWVGVYSLGNMVELHGRIDDALAAHGFGREERRYTPHLTLARVRREQSAAVNTFISEVRNTVAVPALEVDVREVSLMRSTLQPSGAVYERVAAFPLGGA